jgi:hypothetical protein
MTLLNFDVRFTPESGIPRRHHDVSFWPEADIVRADKESKRQFQSKSFAVFWLITNSSFAGCSTGKSLSLA